MSDPASNTPEFLFPAKPIAPDGVTRFGWKQDLLDNADREEGYESWGEAYWESQMEDSFLASVAKWYYTPDGIDPDFEVTPELYTEYALDLGLDAYEKLKSSTSFGEFTYRAEQIRNSNTHRSKLANTDYGWTAGLAAGITDPAFLASGYVTMGLGAGAGVGTKLGLGGRAALEAGKLSRREGLIRGGLISTIAETPLISTQAAISDTFGAEDAALSVLLSTTAGGALGTLLPKSTVNRSWDSVSDATRLAAMEVQAKEINTYAQQVRRTARGEAMLPHTELPAMPTRADLDNEAARLDGLLEETDEALMNPDYQIGDFSDVKLAALAEEKRVLEIRQQAIREARDAIQDRIDFNDGKVVVQRPLIESQTDASQWIPGQEMMDMIVTRNALVDQELSGIPFDRDGYGSFGMLDSKERLKFLSTPKEGPNGDTFIGKLYNLWEQIPLKGARAPRLLNSKNPRVRALASIVAEDGMLRTKYPLTAVAERQANQAMTVLSQKSVNIYNQAKKATNRTGLRGIGFRREFYRDALKYVRSGELPDNPTLAPYVRDYGEAIRLHFKTLHEYGVKHGVIPEDVPSDIFYFPRRGNRDVIQRLVLDNKRFGRDWLVTGLTDSLIKGSAAKGLTLTPKQARVLANKWVTIQLDRKRSFNRLRDSQQFTKERAELKKELEAYNVPESMLDEFFDTFVPKNLENFSHAQRRMVFDEAFIWKDKEGNDFHFGDILDNDVDAQIELYTRRITGAVAWKDTRDILKNMFPNAGIEDIDNIFTTDQLKSFLAQGRATGLTDFEDYFVDQLYRYFFQLPLIQSEGTFGHRSGLAKFGRGLLWLQHVRVMNQVGLAAIPEVFAAVGTHGTKLIGQLLDFKGMSRVTAEGGKRARMELSVMEAIAGGSSTDLLRRLHLHRLNADEDFAGSGFSSVGLKRSLSGIRNLISDITHRNPIGQGPMDVWTRGGVLSAAIQEFLFDIAKIGNKAGPAGFYAKANVKATRRLADLGIEPEWQERIWMAMQRPGAVGTQQGEHGFFSSFDLEAWQDWEAVEVFGTALCRHVNRVIQRSDFTTRAPWMDSLAGRIIMQFRTFAYVANSKQIAYNVSRFDSVAFNTMIMGLVGGMFSYYSTIQAKTAGMSAEDRKKHLSDYLYEGEWWELDKYHWDKIALNGFSRTPIGATITPFYSQAEDLAGVDPKDKLFNNWSRTTGMATNLLMGNPTIDWLDNASSFAYGSAKDLFQGRPVLTQENLDNVYKLGPLQNILGAHNLIKRFGEELGLPLD